MLKFYTEFSTSPVLAKIPYVPFIPRQLYVPLSEQTPELSKNKNRHEKFSWENKYNAYWSKALESIVKPVQLIDADVVVLPFDWYWFRGQHWLPNKQYPIAKAVRQVNTSLYKKALSAGKPTILFFKGDRSHEPTPFAEAITFRESIYASKKQPLDYCQPAFSEDIARQTYGDLQKQPSESLVLREKKEKPTIGFCGFSPVPGASDLITDLAYQLYSLLSTRHFDVSPHYGEQLRYRAIKLMNSSTDVDTNFIVRDKSVFIGNSDLSQKKRFRQEFIDNMVNSDYVLCCRGSGNYSFRVYETLCMGRIPVIVAPDSLLPFESHIDWENYCLIVQESDLQSISQRVVQHYSSLSRDAYLEMQVACRKIWETYLSPQGFFSHISLHFNHLISR